MSCTGLFAERCSNRQRLPPDVEPPFDGKLEAELQRISKTLGEDEPILKKCGILVTWYIYITPFLGGTVPSIFTLVYTYIHILYVENQ